MREKECPHDELEWLSSQKAEKGYNKYYRCLKCRSVLVRSDKGIIYMIPPPS